VSALERIQDLLPPPYSLAGDAVLTSILNVLALQLDAAAEDLDRVRQSHWIATAYRLIDVEKIGALFGIKRLDWETRDLYRDRLLARIVAGRDGAIGPQEIRQFVYTYLVGAEQAMGATLVPGLQTLDVTGAYQPPPGRERFAPLRLIENPPVARVSQDLAARNGRVSHLFRWRDTNRGLDDAWPDIRIAGVAGKLTAGPVLLNTTTGDLLGYRGRLKLGQSLRISITPDKSPQAQGTLDDQDVSDLLFSVANYQMGQPLDKAVTPAHMPRLARGANDWVFFLLGEYGLRGLNSFGFGMPSDEMEEGVFNESRFDRALFPAGTKAQLSIAWDETQPAAFTVEVPRRIVIDPGGVLQGGQTAYGAAEAALRSSIAELHAAGVQSQVQFSPFTEHQSQSDRCRILGVWIPAEIGPSGRTDDVSQGGRFGEPALGGTRFE